MRVNPFVLPIAVIVLLLGSVFAAQALGQWSTSGRTAVNLASLDPADIKGWMTLQQVADGLAISPEELYAIGEIPADVPLSTALKDMEKLVPDFEVSALRERLAERLAAPQP